MDKINKKRRIRGVVVSDAMDKTRVVVVDSTKRDRKYGKYYRVSKRLKAHDEKNEYKKGDEVVIEETRPLSKEKRWRITGRAGFT